MSIGVTSKSIESTSKPIEVTFESRRDKFAKNESQCMLRGKYRSRAFGIQNDDAFEGLEVN